MTLNAVRKAEHSEIYEPLPLDSVVNHFLSYSSEFILREQNKFQNAMLLVSGSVVVDRSKVDENGEIVRTTGDEISAQFQSIPLTFQNNLARLKAKLISEMSEAGTSWFWLGE